MTEMIKLWVLTHIDRIVAVALLSFALGKVAMDPREFVAYLLRGLAQEIKILADNCTSMFDLLMVLLPATWNSTLGVLTRAHTKLSEVAR